MVFFDTCNANATEGISILAQSLLKTTGKVSAGIKDKEYVCIASNMTLKLDSHACVCQICRHVQRRAHGPESSG